MTSPRCALCNAINDLLNAIAQSLFAFFLLTKVRWDLFEGARDGMFIDGHEDRIVHIDGSEVRQWELFTQPMEKNIEDCLKIDGNTKEDCPEGSRFEVAVFNVTNPEEVVLDGAKAHVQEIGALLFIKKYETFNASREKLDSHGVVRYQTNTTLKLDEARCDEACRSLLDMEIVIPNLLWATLAATGSERAVAVAQVFNNISSGKSGSELLEAVNTTFSLSSAEEIEGFTNFFITSGFMQEFNINVFLARASLGSPCFLGTLMFHQDKCKEILDILMAMVPSVWEAKVAEWSSVYRTGRAGPVFIRVTVAQALGWKGAGYLDPAVPLSPPASYAILYEGADPPGYFKEMQVSSRFGAEGVSYMSKVNGVAYDCRHDADCQWSFGKALDACEVSPTCTPANMSGYRGTQFPGRVWDEAEGYGDAFTSRHTRVRTISPAGTGAVLRSLGEKTWHFRHRGSSYDLKYSHWIMESADQRIENCDGSMPGSPGYDCFSPVGTVNAAPLSFGAPIYSSTAMFADAESVDLRKPNPYAFGYHPLSKIHITRCSGNAWCEDTGSDKTSTVSWFEPELGVPIGGWAVVHLNVRLGHGPTVSSLHPALADMLVPVLWFREGSDPSKKTMAGLTELQRTPPRLHLFAILTYSGAGFNVFMFFVCMGQTFRLRRKLRRQAEEEKPTGEGDEGSREQEAQPSSSPGSSPTTSADPTRSWAPLRGMTVGKGSPPDSTTADDSVPV